MKIVFLIAACASICAVVLICLFLFANGLPAIAEIGPLKFLTGTTWRPANNLYGILPMILGSIYAVSYTHLGQNHLVAVLAGTFAADRGD